MSGWRKRQVIEMAREAGFEQVGHDSFQELTARMEAFATLVREDEREACAKVCETLGVHPALNVYAGGPEWYKHGKDLAAAIRARGQA